MPITLDASTPAIVTTTADPVSTAAFSPPDKSLLVACLMIQDSTDTAQSVTDSVGLTWTQRVTRLTSQGGPAGQTGIWTAPCPTARTGMTVTASVDSVTSNMGLKVWVFNGVDLTNPVGATGGGGITTGGNNWSPSTYTSTVNHSRGVAAAHDWSHLGLPTSTDDEDAADISGSLSCCPLIKTANTTPASTSVTMNFDAAGSGTPFWKACWAELLPSTAGPLRLRNSFNGGSDSVAITTLNSGGASGNAFNSVGGSATFENSNATGFRSPMTCLFSSTSDRLRWDGIVLSGREIWIREYVYLTANPSVSAIIAFITTVVGASSNLLVYVDTNGKLAINDTNNAQVGLTTTSITLNTWVRLEVYCLTGTTTANGAFEARLYNTAESMTPTETISGSGLNFTTTLPDRISWACSTGITSYQADDFAASDTGWIGPASLAPPPIRNRARAVLLVR